MEAVEGVEGGASHIRDTWAARPSRVLGLATFQTFHAFRAARPLGSLAFRWKVSRKAWKLAQQAPPTPCRLSRWGPGG